MSAKLKTKEIISCIVCGVKSSELKTGFKHFGPVGAAIGAVMIGLAEQIGLTYFPNYAISFTFLLMVLVLAIFPRGFFGRT